MVKNTVGGKKGKMLANKTGNMRKEQIRLIEVPEIEMEAEKEVEIELPKQPESTETKIRKSFFDKYVDKIKEFLDNAE